MGSAEGEDDQNGSDGEAGGARPAACGDAWAVLLALPVLALPVLFHFEERRRVASARTHCEALCWQGENFFPGRDLLHRGENRHQLLLDPSAHQSMATPGLVVATDALLLVAQSLTADAPTVPTDSQPPSTPDIVGASAEAPTEAPPADAPAAARADASVDVPADNTAELHPQPPAAAVAVAPAKSPVAAPLAGATPRLVTQARPPEPQPRPRPRPRPRTSDGGRLTASSASAQLKANSTSLWRAAEHGDVGRLRMLLDAGCDIDAPCPDAGWRGKSALAAAVDGGEPAAVRFLLQRGSDPNRPDGDGDRYPLHWASAFGDRHLSNPSPRPNPRPIPRPDPRPIPRPDPRPTPRPNSRPNPNPNHNHNSNPDPNSNPDLQP